MGWILNGAYEWFLEFCPLFQRIIGSRLSGEEKAVTPKYGVPFYQP